MEAKGKIGIRLREWQQLASKIVKGKLPKLQVHILLTLYFDHHVSIIWIGQ